MNIHVFVDISLQLSMLLWISIWISLDFYGYPCIDLLWILVSGDLERETLGNSGTMQSPEKFHTDIRATLLKFMDGPSGPKSREYCQGQLYKILKRE